jgi:hypothetical protein
VSGDDDLLGAWRRSIAGLQGYSSHPPRPPSVDALRRWAEHEILQKYALGIHADDPGEAWRRSIVDLIDAGHAPSRDMLRNISTELKQAWWPDCKRDQRSRESAFLFYVQVLIDHLAAEKYGNARGARTKAEADVARLHSLSVAALHRKRMRFRARRKRTAE